MSGKRAISWRRVSDTGVIRVRQAMSTHDPPNALCPGDGLRKYIPCANCSDRSDDRRHSSFPTLRRPPACNNLPAGSWRRRKWDAPSCRRLSSAVAIMTDRSISSCRSASAHLSCVQTVVYQQASRPFLKLDLLTSGCIFHFTARRGGEGPTVTPRSRLGGLVVLGSDE